MRRPLPLLAWPANLVAAIFLVSTLGLGPAAHAQTKGKPVAIETWTLKNGLKVVFAARQGVPLVGVQIVYHVGSRDEKPGTRGIARMLRELMFRGSARVAPGGHSRLMARIGARAGAQGDEDLTWFFDTVPAPYLGLALELEADRMSGIRISEESVSAVRQFVIGTRQRQVDGSVMGKSIELLRGDVYGAHPYANGTSGTTADLRRISVDDCERFARAYFTASNATLVIAGSTSSPAVHQLVDQHFGSLPLVARPPSSVGFTPALAAPPRSLRLPVERPIVAVGAPLPRLSAKERASMLVMAEILAGGSAGRLSNSLVAPQGPTLAAGGAPSMLEDGGMWVFFAVHEPGHTSDEIRRALLDEIARVRTKPIDLDELTAAQLRAAATVSGRLATAEGLASALATALVVQGNPELALALPQSLLDVSQTDLGRVANQYFREDMLSILMLSPEGRVAPKASEP